MFLCKNVQRRAAPDSTHPNAAALVRKTRALDLAGLAPPDRNSGAQCEGLSSGDGSLTSLDGPACLPRRRRIEACHGSSSQPGPPVKVKGWHLRLPKELQCRGMPHIHGPAMLPGNGKNKWRLWSTWTDIPRDICCPPAPDMLDMSFQICQIRQSRSSGEAGSTGTPRSTPHLGAAGSHNTGGLVAPDTQVGLQTRRKAWSGH